MTTDLANNIVNDVFAGTLKTHSKSSIFDDLTDFVEAREVRITMIYKTVRS